MSRGIRAIFGVLNRWWWIAVVIMATLWVWQRYAVVRAGQSVTQLNSSVETLEVARDALLAENATLDARGRIESIAVSRLGLKPTSADQIRRLGQNTIETDDDIEGTESQNSQDRAEGTGKAESSAIPPAQNKDSR